MIEDASDVLGVKLVAEYLKIKKVANPIKILDHQLRRKAQNCSKGSQNAFKDPEFCLVSALYPEIHQEASKNKLPIFRLCTLVKHSLTKDIAIKSLFDDVLAICKAFPRAKFVNRHFFDIFAGMLNHPFLVTRLLKQKLVSEVGAYNVYLSQNGAWNEVVVDDLLIKPYTQKKPRKVFKRLSNRPWGYIEGVSMPELAIGVLKVIEKGVLKLMTDSKNGAKNGLNLGGIDHFGAFEDVLECLLGCSVELFKINDFIVGVRSCSEKSKEFISNEYSVLEEHNTAGRTCLKSPEITFFAKISKLLKRGNLLFLSNKNTIATRFGAFYDENQVFKPNRYYSVVKIHKNGQNSFSLILRNLETIESKESTNESQRDSQESLEASSDDQFTFCMSFEDVLKNFNFLVVGAVEPGLRYQSVTLDQTEVVEKGGNVASFVKIKVDSGAEFDLFLSFSPPSDTIQESIPLPKGVSKASSEAGALKSVEFCSRPISTSIQIIRLKRPKKHVFEIAAGYKEAQDDISEPLFQTIAQKTTQNSNTSQVRIRLIPGEYLVLLSTAKTQPPSETPKNDSKGSKSHLGGEFTFSARSSSTFKISLIEEETKLSLIHDYHEIMRLGYTALTKAQNRLGLPWRHISPKILVEAKQREIKGSDVVSRLYFNENCGFIVYMVENIGFEFLVDLRLFFGYDCRKYQLLASVGGVVESVDRNGLWLLSFGFNKVGRKNPIFLILRPNPAFLGEDSDPQGHPQSFRAAGKGLGRYENWKIDDLEKMDLEAISEREESSDHHGVSIWDYGDRPPPDYGLEMIVVTKVEKIRNQPKIEYKSQKSSSKLLTGKNDHQEQILELKKFVFGSENRNLVTQSKNHFMNFLNKLTKETIKTDNPDTFQAFFDASYLEIVQKIVLLRQKLDRSENFKNNENQLSNSQERVLSLFWSIVNDLQRLKSSSKSENTPKKSNVNMRGFESSRSLKKINSMIRQLEVSRKDPIIKSQRLKLKEIKTFVISLFDEFYLKKAKKRGFVSITQLLTPRMLRKKPQNELKSFSKSIIQNIVYAEKNKNLGRNEARNLLRSSLEPCSTGQRPIPNLPKSPSMELSGGPKKHPLRFSSQDDSNPDPQPPSTINLFPDSDLKKLQKSQKSEKSNFQKYNSLSLLWSPNHKEIPSRAPLRGSSSSKNRNRAKEITETKKIKNFERVNSGVIFGPIGYRSPVKRFNSQHLTARSYPAMPMALTARSCKKKSKVEKSQKYGFKSSRKLNHGRSGRLMYSASSPKPKNPPKNSKRANFTSNSKTFLKRLRDIRDSTRHTQGSKPLKSLRSRPLNRPKKTVSASKIKTKKKADYGVLKGSWNLNIKNVLSHVLEDKQKVSLDLSNKKFSSREKEALDRIVNKFEHSGVNDRHQRAFEDEVLEFYAGRCPRKVRFEVKEAEMELLSKQHKLVDAKVLELIEQSDGSNEVSEAKDRDSQTENVVFGQKKGDSENSQNQLSGGIGEDIEDDCDENSMVLSKDSSLNENLPSLGSRKASERQYEGCSVFDHFEEESQFSPILSKEMHLGIPGLPGIPSKNAVSGDFGEKSKITKFEFSDVSGNRSPSNRSSQRFNKSMAKQKPKFASSSIPVNQKFLIFFS